MNEFDELKDIVLNNELDSNNKNKKRLILVAFLVILFLIVLVVMKLVKDSTNNDMISQMEVPKIESLNNNIDKQVFEQIPIEEDELGEDDLSSDEILKDIAKKEEVSKATKEVKEKTLEEIIAEQKSKLVKKVEVATPKVEVISPKIEKVESVKKVVKEEVAKKPFTPKPKVPVNNLLVGTYVQVGAIHRNKPNNKFLQSLKDKNYTYRLYDISVKGKVYTKVLIGPYRTNSDLNVALKEIRAKVNSSAFVYRVKN